MNKATLLLYLINLTLIGALPFFFFKTGRFNLMWCLTSAPYPVCAAFLVWAYLTGYSGPWSDVLAVASVPFSVGSIALIFLTVGTHRVPLALWHQKNDAPHHIVTYGPYRRIRHPFYASFLLALFGAFLFSPQPGTLVTFMYALVFLNVTAGKEEKRLMSSEYGSEYRRYFQHTGRFWPKLQSGAVDEYERSVR
jgi:protein-S-isoprenylcysteine O-methyltransferase Ste14